MGLCLGSFVAADLKWEPGPINEQTNNDLRVNTALFRVSDLPEVVFLLCFKIEGRDVVEQQTDPGGGDTVVEAFPCDL